MPADSELITNAEPQDYHLHYGLEHAPFTVGSDTSLFVLSAGHELALDKMYRALLSRKSLMLITGEPGTGKTMLLKTLMELADEHCEFLRIHPEDLEASSAKQAQSLSRLSALVLSAAGVDQQPENKDRTSQALQSGSNNNSLNKGGSSSSALLRDYIHKSRDRTRRPTIVVDEAQRLTNTGLETVRCWSNMGDHSDGGLQILLVGHSALRDRLNTKALTSLKQRIGMRCDLPALNVIETQNYIEHRCTLAGATHSLFDQAIIIRIYSLTNGYPRLINTVADALLLHTYLRGGRTVTLADVAQVSHDLDLNYAPIIKRSDQFNAKPVDVN